MIFLSFFFSSSHNWQQLPRLPWLHFSLLKLLASRTPLLFKDSCSHFKSFLAVRNQFWRGVRAWNGCGQCWKGNEIKPCLRLWERENPPEQWGLNECIKTVLIPLHHVCPQGTCSRSPEFYLRLIFNRSWQRCQRHEVKKKNFFFSAVFHQRKPHQGHVGFLPLPTLPPWPDVRYPLGYPSSALDCSREKGPLPVLPTLLKAVDGLFQYDCQMLIN